MMELILFLSGFLMSIWDVHQAAHALGSGEPLRQALKWRALGLLFVLIMSIGLFGLSYGMNRLVESSPNLTRLNQLPTDWGADQPADKRERNSRTVASLVFVDSGKLGMYFDSSRGWQRYIPTEDDMSKHDQNVVNQFVIKSAATYAKPLAFASLILWLIIALLGWRAGRINTLTNPSFKRN